MFSFLVPDPSTDGPKFEFGLGQDGVAAYYPTLPNVPGAASSWHVAEWHTPETLDPQVLLAGDFAETDPILGVPAYSWTTPNQAIRLSAYGSDGAYSYRLSDFGGSLTTSGGQNLFLEADLSGTLPTFNHPIDFDADEAITATKTGGVAQQVGNHFTIGYNVPGSPTYDPKKPTISGFLQNMLSDSRGAVSSYLDASAPFMYNASGEGSLAFVPATQLSHVHIDLNAALLQFLAAYKGASTPADFSDLSKWSLLSVYVGDETDGLGGVSLDVSHPSLTTDTTAAYVASSSSDVGTVTQLAPIAGIVSFTDTSTGIASVAKPQAYSGPISYLQNQFIWASATGVAAETHSANVFLKGGAGNDALSVYSGSNVLDGGTGSNYLVGGTGDDGGADSFYVDGRVKDTTWSTISNFHSRDMVLLWGFDSTHSKLAWNDNMGATGYQGATISCAIDGVNTSTLLTFAGRTVSDITSSSTITMGDIQGTKYLMVTAR